MTAMTAARTRPAGIPARGRPDQGSKAFNRLAATCVTLFALVWLVPFCAAYPIVPIVAGVAAGMFVNFAMSRRVVFRARP